MPKQRITKEMVVNAAFEIARNQGMEQVMVKNIADKIGCSTQPIYSYCRNMEGLKEDVFEKVNQFIRKYTEAHIDREDVFRSTGKTYIKLAQEEPHLFRIFILHQRRGIFSLNDFYQSETNPETAEIIAETLHISQTQAKELHLNMLIYTMGIGAIFSVTTPGIPQNEIYERQEAAYKAFVKQILEQES